MDNAGGAAVYLFIYSRFFISKEHEVLIFFITLLLFLHCRRMHPPASCVQLARGTWTRLMITSRTDWTSTHLIKWDGFDRLPIQRSMFVCQWQQDPIHRFHLTKQIRLWRRVHFRSGGGSVSGRRRLCVELNVIVEWDHVFSWYLLPSSWFIARWSLVENGPLNVWVWSLFCCSRPSTLSFLCLCLLDFKLTSKSFWYIYMFLLFLSGRWYLAFFL